MVWEWERDPLKLPDADHVVVGTTVCVPLCERDAEVERVGVRTAVLLGALCVRLRDSVRGTESEIEWLKVAERERICVGFSVSDTEQLVLTEGETVWLALLDRLPLVVRVKVVVRLRLSVVVVVKVGLGVGSGVGGEGVAEGVGVLTTVGVGDGERLPDGMVAVESVGEAEWLGEVLLLGLGGLRVQVSVRVRP